MPLIIKILIPVLITAVVGTGGVIIWKITSQPVIPDLTATATLKVNAIDNSITVPFETPITLSWESKNVDNCLISGDWYSPVSTSGSQSVGKITKPANYTLDCFDSDGKKISSSVAVNIDNKTIPQEFLSSLSLTDLFKDFRYFWKKELCSGLKNDPDVVALQTALFFEGLLSPQEKITGNYDDDTLQAVKKFQENYGITPPTGCVKSQTIAKLNDLFYYYNYGDQLAVQESSQRQITATKQKISSYIAAPIVPEITPKIIAPTMGTTTAPKATTTSAISAPKPYIDMFKVNNSARSVVSVKKGETATLTWTSKNTKSCVASGNWTGSKATSNTTGEITEPINKYSTFKLTCAGENNQNAAKSVTVSIPSTYTTPVVDNRPIILGIAKTYCTTIDPVFNRVVVQCRIKLKGKNFDRHANEIIIVCDKNWISLNKGICQFYEDSIKGAFLSSKNGNIDSSSDKGDETIEFDINAFICSAIKISVKTAAGGESDKVGERLCYQ